MSPNRPTSSQRRGFTFVELLFAVMILGVGFIMVAAIFPVAIRQTQTNLEETSAAALGRDAANMIQRLASDQIMADTGGVVACPDAFWAAIRGNLRLDRDTRRAWTAMYRRNPGETCAQIYLLAVESRNRPTYDVRDITPAGDSPANLQPRNVRVDLTHSADGRDIVEIRQNLTTGNHAAAAEGAYLIVASDGVAGPNTGRVYRLGNARPDLSPTTWELMPGSNTQSDDEDLSGASALLIGRALADPSRPYDPSSNPYEGPAQDIGLYSTFVRVH